MDSEKNKKNLRYAISDFCKWRVSQNKCDPDDDCDFCPVNHAYDMARNDGDCGEDED